MLKSEILQSEVKIGKSEIYLKSIDGLNLFSQTWSPDRIPRGVINLVHGFGEHSGRYDAWAKCFTLEGFVVRSFDLRGHGRSEGKRGYASNYDKFINDLLLFLENGKKWFPDLPTFLYGHSFGGNLVLNYAIQNNISFTGIVVTSPWLDLKYQPSTIKMIFGRLFKKIMPGAVFKTGLNPGVISRDLRVVHSYKNDILVHDQISLKLFFQICENGLKASRSIFKINVPLLVMHGNGDELISCKTTREFVRNASDKTNYVEWEGGFHELHNDIDKEKVFDILKTWLNKYL
jgi:alpha-beta hydrolase superfamily lysophospholipase